MCPCFCCATTVVPCLIFASSICFCKYSLRDNNLIVVNRGVISSIFIDEAAAGGISKPNKLHDDELRLG